MTQSEHEMDKNRKTNWLAIAVLATLTLTIYNITQTLTLKGKVAEINQSNALATTNRLAMDDELHALTNAIVKKYPDIVDIMVKARQSAILSSEPTID